MKRRELLKFSAISAGLGALSGKVSSQPIKAFFNHGVASGDPTQDKVILWTRVTPNRPGNIKVTLEVATTQDFQNIVFQRDLYTNPTKTTRSSMISKQASFLNRVKAFTTDFMSIISILKPVDLRLFQRVIQALLV